MMKELRLHFEDILTFFFFTFPCGVKQKILNCPITKILFSNFPLLFNSNQPEYSAVSPLVFKSGSINSIF